MMIKEYQKYLLLQNVDTSYSSKIFKSYIDDDEYNIVCNVIYNGFPSESYYNNHIDFIGLDRINMKLKKPDGWDFKTEYIDVNVINNKDYSARWNIEATIKKGKDKSIFSNWVFTPDDISDYIIEGALKLRNRSLLTTDLFERTMTTSFDLSNHTSELLNKFESKFKKGSYTQLTDQELSSIGELKTKLRNNYSNMSINKNALDKEVCLEKVITAIAKKEGYLSVFLYYSDSIHKTLVKARELIHNVFQRNIPHPKKVQIIDKIVELMNDDRDKKRNQWGEMGNYTPNKTALNFKTFNEDWDYTYVNERVNHAISLLPAEPTGTDDTT